ncbi:FG-GAP repeat domain-containing protein [Streptomyces sp. NPDC052236]|uniref:FG-GAP repeat domain-containing protein n=1 Tax=Streptomyces sp. NPDC052236 TaxID=3365686 RepID=UPI0037D05CEF
MAKSFGRKRGRVLSRLAVAAIAAALVGTSAGAAVADNPVPRSAKSALPDTGAGIAADAAAESADAPVNALYGVDKNGDFWGYAPNGTGAFDAREELGFGFNYVKHAVQVDHNADGSSDGTWEINTDGGFDYYPWGEEAVSAGTGWNIYNKIVSPGNLASTVADDLLARDTAGVLWLYQGNGNGTVKSRVRVGSGWNAYTQIAGQGDLSGDGRADIVARDTAGALYLYKGTGSATAPFGARIKVGASGWNTYNTLVSVGDIDLDGMTDLIARDTAGALWLYKGTGSATAPYKARVKIGASGWNIYRLLL